MADTSCLAARADLDLRLAVGSVGISPASLGLCWLLLRARSGAHRTRDSQRLAPGSSGCNGRMDPLNVDQ